MELKFKKMHESAVMPAYAHDTDAGIDLTTIGFSQEFDKSGKMILVYHTGLAVEIPEGHVGLLFMRSSVAERSLVLTNAVGVIDAGYRGELIGKFKITTDALPTVYKEGERILQLIVLPYPKMEITMVEELSKSERGENGYGSTNETAETPAKGEVAEETVTAEEIAA